MGRSQNLESWDERERVGRKFFPSPQTSTFYVIQNGGLYTRYRNAQICPEMQVNEMQALYDKHHKVSSFPKSHQNTYDSVRYEVII